jgi:hypothetical protein
MEIKELVLYPADAFAFVGVFTNKNSYVKEPHKISPNLHSGIVII